MESQRIRLTDSYPLELHYIKALLLQKQYRQCITACRNALKRDDEKLTKQPLQHTFVQFYLALAHDELARAMHNFSQAKVPAFNQAQQFYLDALTALPQPEECIKSLVDSAPERRHDSCHASQSSSRHTSGASFSMSDAPPSQSHLSEFPWMSPPTHIRNNSLPTRSPPINSPGTTTSDLDDLESHESFDEIMTPNRMPKLERDYSSISLLQPPQQQTSHRLIKPIRLGSPAKPYHVSRASTYSGKVQQRRSALPRLNTTASNGFPVWKQLLTRSEQVSPVDVESPVSPLGSEGDSITSDASTISPISPETPMAGLQFGKSNQAITQLPSTNRLNEHLQAMHVQLQSHMKLLQDAKQQTLETQAERSAARTAPDQGGKLTALIDAAGAKNKHLSQSRSYWSFTPEDVKVLEMQKRVEAGRQRGWMRKRFEPGRYVELADAALAEL